MLPSLFAKDHKERVSVRRRIFVGVHLLVLSAGDRLDGRWEPVHQGHERRRAVELAKVAVSLGAAGVLDAFRSSLLQLAQLMNRFIEGAQSRQRAGEVEARAQLTRIDEDRLGEVVLRLNVVALAMSPKAALVEGLGELSGVVLARRI